MDVDEIRSRDLINMLQRKSRQVNACRLNLYSKRFDLLLSHIY